jgi:hypothetical protein
MSTTSADKAIAIVKKRALTRENMRRLRAGRKLERTQDYVRALRAELEAVRPQ